MQAAFLLILAALALSASAFRIAKTTVPRIATTSLRVINVGREDLPGALGNTVFDPLGLSSNLTPRDLKLWREAELKHGRVAMLAALAFIVQEKFHPLFGMKDMLMGAPIIHFQQVQNIPFFVIALMSSIASIEASSILKYWYTDEKTGRSYQKDDVLPGDLGFDPFSLSPDKDEQVKSTYNKVNKDMKSMMSKELNNGRVAMIGVAGMAAQMLVDNRGILEHYNKFGFSWAGPLTGILPGPL